MISDVEPTLIVPEMPRTNGHASSLPPDSTPPGFIPPGSSIHEIAFVAQPAASADVLLTLPAPVGRRAVTVKRDPASSNPDEVALTLLSIQAAPRLESNEHEAEALVRMQHWVAAGASHHDTSPPQVVTLQGAHLCWSAGRVAILAQPERLEAVRRAVIEVAYYEGELRDIERTIGEEWPQLEADMPLAFEFEQRSIGKRKQLRKRFQQVLTLRARLARIGPYVHSPHQHPPTLASQIGERLRERTRMMHRHEFVGEQIEVFQNVYEMCGQRASDFMLTRSGNTLEWVIIILLLTQILLYGFEMLSNMGP
jgi:hypothetical protein